MKKFLLAAFAAISMTAVAVAGPDVEVIPEPTELSNFYVAGAYTYVDTGVNFNGVEVIEGTNNAGSIAAGYIVLPYLAVEGRYSWLASNTYTDIGGYTEDLDGSNWSLFLKPMYTIADSGVTVYGLIGYGQTKLDFANGDEFMGWNGSFQYGAGLAYAVTENVSVFADYTKLQNDVDTSDTALPFTADVDAFNVGVAYRF